jgi:NADH dehydrogenase
VTQCDYADVDSLARELALADFVVHLPGIIKESRVNTFEMAHEQACTALVSALKDSKVKGVLYLSILGAEEHSQNACLASKARAEKILLTGPVPTRVIKVPMVLGEGDFASRAILHKAHRSIGFELRAASLEQPIYAGDVISALLSSIASGPHRDVLELAGPESLSRRALIQRSAKLLGTTTRIVSLPLALGLLFAAVFELLLPAPPVTRAMLGVLDHDDAEDSSTAVANLGLTLTPLDVTLEKVLLVA